MEQLGGSLLHAIVGRSASPGRKGHVMGLRLQVLRSLDFCQGQEACASVPSWFWGQIASLVVPEMKRGVGGRVSGSGGQVTRHLPTQPRREGFQPGLRTPGRRISSWSVFQEHKLRETPHASTLAEVDGVTCCPSSPMAS